MKVHLAALFLIFASAVPAPTRTPSQQITVYVSPSGNDSIGQSVAYHLRERISRSSRYTLRSEADATFQINLASIDINTAVNRQQGEWSAVSVVFLAHEQRGTWLYLNQGIEITGRDRADSTASEILSFFDDVMAHISTGQAN